MKGRTTLTELDNMPYKYIQTLYYGAWKQSLSKENQGEELEEAIEEMTDI